MFCERLRDWKNCSFMYKTERAEELLTRQPADLHTSNFLSCHSWSSVILRSIEGLLGRLGRVLGRLGGFLGVSCDLLGRLGTSNGRLEGVLNVPGRVLGRIGGVLEAS